MQHAVIKYIDEGDRNLIDAFMQNQKVTILPPVSGGSNEACRATNELVSLRRSEFRAAARLAKKAATK